MTCRHAALATWDRYWHSFLQSRRQHCSSWWGRPANSGLQGLGVDGLCELGLVKPCSCAALVQQPRYPVVVAAGMVQHAEMVSVVSFRVCIDA